MRGSCGPYKNELCLIVSYLLKENITVLDAVIGKSYIAGKMYESFLLVKNDIPHLKTVQILSDNQKKHVLKYLTLPLIAKPISASQGRGVTLIQTSEELASFSLLNGSDKYLFQEYIPIQYDIRVFVIGNNALGAMRRNVIPGDVRSNASLGGKPEYFKLTPPLQDIAVRATHAYKYDIAGVDILEKDGEFIVLEVNNAPQWTAFKKITGINPAPQIVSYAYQKYRDQHPLNYTPHEEYCFL